MSWFLPINSLAITLLEVRGINKAARNDRKQALACVESQFQDFDPCKVGPVEEEGRVWQNYQEHKEPFQASISLHIGVMAACHIKHSCIHRKGGHLDRR
jgi:hypothetical protein